MNIHSTHKTLETIKKMDVHVPRKPKKLAERTGDKKRKSSSNRDANPLNRKKSNKTVLSVRNTAEPKQPTILGIVGNMRKTEL